MARGFESKSVADQQEEAERRRSIRAEQRGPDPVLLARRHSLELAKADIQRRMGAATAPNHRKMLDRALAALEKELAALQ